MTGARVTGDFNATGNITRGGTLRPDVPRSNLELESLAEYPIPFVGWRVWDALHTNLPGTPATDDLGLVGGTFGTDGPTLQTEDLKAAGATNKYARVVLTLPPEYSEATNVRLRFTAGMLTTIADTSATIDVEAYKLDEAGSVGSDLVTTAAQSINSLTLADKDFVLTASGLAAGDQIDVRVTVAISDSATATEVKGVIASAILLCDIRG